MAREPVRDYLSQVGAQIRWRRARRTLLAELSDHIADQARAFEEAGLPGPEALDRAVAEMGDPAEVGRALDKLHRPQTRWELVGFVAALACAGAAAQCLLLRGTPGGDLSITRHLSGLLAGGILFVIAWLSDCTRLFRRNGTAFALPALLFAAGFLVVPWLGISASGRFHPPLPTYLVLLMPAAYGGMLSRLKGRGWPAVLLCGIAALLLPLAALLVPMLTAWLIAAGAMLLVLGAAVCMGWFSCKKPLGLLCAWGVPGGLCAAGLAALGSTYYGFSRLSLFLHPERDPLGGGWMYLQLRSGTGPDWRISAHSFDLMLSALAQQNSLGRWVFPLAAVLFVLLAVLVLRRVRRLHSGSGKLAALGAFWVLMLQAALFVLFNLGWSPIAPLSLPFLSYGRGFMALNFLLAGLLLSVFRMDALTRDSAVHRSFPPLLPDGTLSLPLPGGTLSLTYRRREQEPEKAPAEDTRPDSMGSL